MVRKSTAERTCYGAFDLIQGEDDGGGDPMKIFKVGGVDNVNQLWEVKSRRGGASYQVLLRFRPSRRVSLALRWITGYSRSRGGKSMQDRLAAELPGCLQYWGVGQKREDVHRMAEANKPFAHYRW